MHDGKKPNGEFVLNSDGTCQGCGSKGPKNRWKIIGERTITATFHRICHTIEYDAKLQMGVVLKPNRSPQSRVFAPMPVSESFEIFGASLSAVNGRYISNGSANGGNKFKHESRNYWVRRNTYGRVWMICPRDGRDCETCIYKLVYAEGELVPRAGEEWEYGSNYSEKTAADDGWSGYEPNRGTPPRVQGATAPVHVVTVSGAGQELCNISASRNSCIHCGGLGRSDYANKHMCSHI